MLLAILSFSCLGVGEGGGMVGTQGWQAEAKTSFQVLWVVSSYSLKPPFAPQALNAEATIGFFHRLAWLLEGDDAPRGYSVATVAPRPGYSFELSVW